MRTLESITSEKLVGVRFWHTWSLVNKISLELWVRASEEHTYVSNASLKKEISDAVLRRNSPVNSQPINGDWRHWNRGY